MMKYAAIIKTIETVPGDERSRTHPGHGYPAYNREVITFRKFIDLDEVRVYVDVQEGGRHFKDNYTLIQYEELKVVKTVSLEIQDAGT